MRPLLGNVTDDAIGPAYRYQIDATIADVYLLSAIDHLSIIGRPVVYVVIDVWSRLIVGLYVGLENASWTVAMMALYHATVDKVTWCREYGIEIEPHEWPNAALSSTILGDHEDNAADVLGWDPVLDKLKVCSSCIKSDIETYGEAYWHRSHQLHASHLCSTHAEPLLLTDTRYFNHYNTPLEQLTVDIGTKKYLPQMSEKTRQRLMEIAAYGERYLNGESGQNGIQPFSETGRAHLRRVYPGHQKDTLDMTKIEKEVVNHFGEECLEILGLSIEPGVRTGFDATVVTPF